MRMAVSWIGIALLAVSCRATASASSKSTVTSPVDQVLRVGGAVGTIKTSVSAPDVSGTQTLMILVQPESGPPTSLCCCTAQNGAGIERPCVYFTCEPAHPDDPCSCEDNKPTLECKPSP